MEIKLELFNVIISFISLVVSSFLTIYMFIKDKKLQDKQMELQKVLFAHQEKQDRLVYINQEKPYIESTFKLIYNSYDFVTDLKLCENVAKKDKALLVKLYSETKQKYQDLFNNFDFKFDIAISYSENNLKQIIASIKHDMATIETNINTCELIHNHKIKSNEEINYEKLKTEIASLIDKILKTHDQINKELALKLNIPNSDKKVMSMFDKFTTKPQSRTKKLNKTKSS